jgi:micrococcal nuclease
VIVALGGEIVRPGAYGRQVMARKLALTLALAVLAALGGGSLLAQQHGLLGSGGSSPESARVQRVVDGDTIVLAGGERVRYIGVDTPESVKPGTPVQCFAKAASHFNSRLVEGERVRLRFDAERRDRYGRLLAYVYRASDGLFVNAELVRRGYARTLTIPPNVEHAGQFARLARLARRQGRGLWSSC